MKLASVRDLKQQLKAEPTLPRAYAAAFARGPRVAALRARLDLAHTRSPHENVVALGIARGIGRRDFRLGARVQIADLEAAMKIVRRVEEATRGECDVRVVPRVVKRARVTRAWFRRRRRPLESGISVGHYTITAGTLGFFVEDTDAIYILSNNHVLADVNAAEPGDPIVQPGPLDSRARRQPVAADVVAVLDRFVPISFSRSNVVDCAIAEVLSGIHIVKGKTKATSKKIKGTKPVTIDDLDREVFKAGRTTGITAGRITQTEVDRLRVDMGDDTVREALFSNQFEVQAPGRADFSDGGDSGSLIVDKQGYARGLLFAGGPDAVTGDDFTYANQIEAVLEKLGVQLLV